MENDKTCFCAGKIRFKNICHTTLRCTPNYRNGGHADVSNQTGIVIRTIVCKLDDVKLQRRVKGGISINWIFIMAVSPNLLSVG